MGRYYQGDIEGKFWFAVQDSRDAVNFGGNEIEIFEEGDEEGETEVIGSTFIFEKEDLPDIQKGLDEATEALGDKLEKLDNFFGVKDGYSYEELGNHLGFKGKEEGMMFGNGRVKDCLVFYARICLGRKIKECVETKGRCEFIADFY